MIRATCYFSGHVQGVGFRATTARLAGGFAVAGFVRNLADGQVELVAEGEKKQVDDFISSVKQHLGRHIAKSSQSCSAATGEFGTAGEGNFSILY